MCTCHVVAERFLPAGITQPNASHIAWCVPNKPNVGVIVDRPGLSRQWYAKRTCCRGSTELDHPAHEGYHCQRDVLIHNFVSGFLPLLEHRAVAIEHAPNHVWLHAYAFIGKS